MRKIRVLIVDDAVVIRRLLTDCLAGDPEIEVVGSAANGRIALTKIPQLNPDLVTLDVEMPELNGLETLVELRKSHPKLPVIMFSTLTERGASATLDALSAGANDYVTKPSNTGSLNLAMQRVRDDLVPKIKHLTGRAVAHDPVPLPRKAPAPAARPAPVVPLQRRTPGPTASGPLGVSMMPAAVRTAETAPVLCASFVPAGNRPGSMFLSWQARRCSSMSRVDASDANSPLWRRSSSWSISPAVVLPSPNCRLRSGKSDVSPRNTLACSLVWGRPSRSIAAAVAPNPMRSTTRFVAVLSE